jgi:hypothetical protein
MATFKALIISGGVTKQIPDADTLNVAAGIISAAATTNLTITAATGVVACTSAATFASTITVTGQSNTNGGIGRSFSGTLNIGNEPNTVAVNFATGVNTTAVSISRTGQLTTIAGNFQVNGTTAFVGTATFNSAAVVGDGIGGPDTLSFNSVNGRLGSIALPDVKWLKEVNHNFYVDDTTTAATPGGNLTISAGLGTAAGGNLSLNAGAGTTNGGVNIGLINTIGVNIGASGVITTVTGNLTQLTGAISLTGNAASQVSTTAGSLTLSGIGMNLQGGGTTALAINSTGTAITVQAGAILGATGTGNINLPNNASARFQIEGSPVTATVTAANLAILTAGPASDASALHTHSGLAGTVTIPASASQTVGDPSGITTGMAVAALAGTGVRTWTRGDASSSAVVSCNFIGIAATSAAQDGLITIIICGQAVIPDAFWDGGVPAHASLGNRVYLSPTTPGNLTLTAPSTLGQWAQRAGILIRGGTGVASINVDPGEGVAI